MEGCPTAVTSDPKVDSVGFLTKRLGRPWESRGYVGLQSGVFGRGVIGRVDVAVLRLEVEYFSRSVVVRIVIQFCLRRDRVSGSTARKASKRQTYLAVGR